MKNFSVKASVLMLMVAFEPAYADITNGSFESGLTGWTTTTAGSAQPVRLGSGAMTVTPSNILIDPSLTNNQYAYTSQTGPGSSLLTQAFTVQSGVNNVFFDIFIKNNAADYSTPDSLNHTGAANQQARFEILKPGSALDTVNPADIIVTVYKTNVGDAATQNWTTRQVDVTAQLASYVGQNVIFRFSQVDNRGYFTLALDNVNVGLTQIAQILSVLSSTTAVGNNPAFSAARIIDGNADLFAQFVGLAGNDVAISNAASETLPLLTGGMKQSMNNTLHGVNRIIQSRQEGQHGRSSGDEFFGDKHAWFKPFGSWANQDDRKGVTGYDVNTYGMVFGADAEISDTNRLGVAFAYARSDVDSNSQVARQSADIDSYQLVFYGSHSLNDTTDISFQADIGQHNTDGKRNISFSGVTANSSYTSWSGHLGAGLSHTYDLSEKTNLTPSIRADYTKVRDEGYSEQNAGVLNLHVKSNITEELILGVDGKLTHAVTEKAQITGNLGVGYDVINEQASITSAFAGAPAATFVTKGLDPSPWVMRGGIGLVSQATETVEISARYDIEARKDFDNQTASVKVRWAF